ncbi:MAG TPA: chemotaxis protein CheC [Blastocatellia bacterium]|nr:chemotaxis protein CheC [Blastocatellia bacterium]HMX29964.1 chemotaxis protein CheC [Blastocatellia bacterium]HMZ20036.1 chemotaxis protein CheC [Blastocatellia bacterium]HNG33517.1 chemotaxis protein CheC [Blastocatellia bacterium]
MELTPTQKDALVELLNIGFGRTADSLSKLTGHRVLLDVPHVAMCPIAELNRTLAGLIEGEIATVHQIFTGSVGGDAMLMLNYEGAVRLKELLTDEPAPAGRLDASAREVLTEVGNILLNACLGTFGNLLHVHVSFSVPRLQLDTLGDLLNSLVVEQQELRYALVVHTGFRLRDSAVRGYLVMVLSVASLDRLLQAVEIWEQTQ